MLKNFLLYNGLFLLLCLTTPSFVRVYVDVNLTPGANNGTSWANAYSDLQVAMDAAAVGSEVWIAAGTFLQTQVPEKSDTEQQSF
jgi:hypothetical protein